MPRQYLFFIYNKGLFLRMKLKSVRHSFAAIVVLVAMLLQVGVRTFHVHQGHSTVRIECEDCSHHRVHDGHLINWDGQSDDCMLCQVLSTQFFAIGDCRFDAIVEQSCQLPSDMQLAVCHGVWHSIRQRGPPSFLL